jgi:hypothetical protein
VLSQLKPKTWQQRNQILLIAIFTFSALLMSAGIYLNGLQPLESFKDGFTVDIEGTLISGELRFNFRKSPTYITFSITPSVIQTDSSWVGRFVNVTVSSMVLDLFLTELPAPHAKIITGWDMQEQPVEFSCITFFEVSNQEKEASFQVEYHFLAGTPNNHLSDLLGSIGFSLASISTVALILRTFKARSGTEITRENDLETKQPGHVCENCGLLAPLWMRYCGQCGSELLQKCTSNSCDSNFPVRARFCPICGTPSGFGQVITSFPREKNQLTRITSFFLVASLAGFLILIVLNTILLVPAYTLVFSNFYLLNKFNFTIFLPFPVLIVVLEGVLLLLYVITIFIAVLYLISRIIYRDVKHLLKISSNKREKLNKLSSNFHQLNENGLVLLFKLYTMSFALQITITFLFTFITNAEITNPVTLPSSGNEEDGLYGAIDDILPSWRSYPSLFIRLIFGLINATIYEEIVIRVLFIGLPLVLIGSLKDFIDGQRKIDLKKVVGLNIAEKRPVNKYEWLLIGLSSLIFGAAHLISWDLWKFFPASIVGIFLGYIFVKKGLAYSVILHAAYDYMAFPLLLRFVNVDALFGASGDIIGFFLAITFPMFLLALIASFFVSGYVFLLKWLEEFIEIIINRKTAEQEEKNSE